MSEDINSENQQAAPKEAQARPSKKSVLHTLSGGALMGTADVIPGVSGGTMLVATGLYDLFIASVADVTRLRLKRSTIGFLVLLGIGDITAILTMSSVVEWGLSNYQHIMFALFIGLTLGGVPLLSHSLRPLSGRAVAGVVAGFLFMIGVSFALREMNLPVNFAVLMMGGFIGSSAMVLPGISGSYLLLMMGLYSPVLEGLSEFKDALQSVDIAAAFDVGVRVILPVGLGVLAGIALLSNAIKFVLHQYHELTVGVLLGLLLGSVISLYPFRQAGPKDLFEQAVPVTGANVAVVLVCIAAGFALTVAIGRLGGQAGVVKKQ